MTSVSPGSVAGGVWAFAVPAKPAQVETRSAASDPRREIDDFDARMMRPPWQCSCPRGHAAGTGRRAARPETSNGLLNVLFNDERSFPLAMYDCQVASVLLQRSRVHDLGIRGVRAGRRAVRAETGRNNGQAATETAQALAPPRAERVARRPQRGAGENSVAGSRGGRGVASSGGPGAPAGTRRRERRARHQRSRIRLPLADP